MFLESDVLIHIYSWLSVCVFLFWLQSTSPITACLFWLSWRPFIHPPVRHNQLIISLLSPFVSPLQIVFCALFQSHPFTHTSVLPRSDVFIFRITDLYPSPGSWARWRCWRSVPSWWRGWWSPGLSARRGPTRSGCVKTARGRRCWWTTCCPATTTDTSYSPRSVKKDREGRSNLRREKWWMRK